MSIGIVPLDLPSRALSTYYTVHLHRKYLNGKGIKLNSDEEKAQWKDVKKMNNHIRYIRHRGNETKDAVEVDMDI